MADDEDDLLPLTKVRREAPGVSAWWYSDLLEYVHDAVMVWALGGRGILYWNRAAEQLYGYSREEVRGKVTHFLLRTQLDTDVASLEEALRHRGIWTGRLCHTTRDGREVTVKSRIILFPPVSDEWIVAELNREIGAPGFAGSWRQRRSRAGTRPQ
jgi:PAS domain S-box-containing protein